MNGGRTGLHGFHREYPIPSRIGVTTSSRDTTIGHAPRSPLRHDLATFVACGPSSLPNDGGGTADGGTDQEDSASSDGTSPDGTSPDPDDSSGAPAGVCGDGQLDPAEACDDGNVINADGCSAACERSGTSVWTLPIEASPLGFGVGLDVRDGSSFAAVQLFDGGLDPTLTVTGVARDGATLGQFIDVGGLSDLDLARQPIAAGPDGTVALGYPVLSEEPDPLRRHLAHVDLTTGDLQWEYLDEVPWLTYYGTTWTPDGIVVMHGTQDDAGLNTIAVDWFDEGGERVHRLLVGGDVSPLMRGAIFPRPITALGVLTVDDADGIDFWWTLGAGDPWGVDPVGMATPGYSPRAYFDGVWLRIWTDTELIEIDEVDHLASTTPREVTGNVLWSDALGFAIGDAQTLSVYGPDSALQWSVELPLSPRFVRADADLGLVVLSDAGFEDIGASEVSLDYFVR